MSDTREVLESRYLAAHVKVKHFEKKIKQEEALADHFGGSKIQGLDKLWDKLQSALAERKECASALQEAKVAY